MRSQAGESVDFGSGAVIGSAGFETGRGRDGGMFGSGASGSVIRSRDPGGLA
jgi:hypothetical protein